MLEKPDSFAQEAERAELEAVIAAFSRSPRLVRLLEYLGGKYFRGESDQLHEYEIATEVFGRSKTAFDAGEDAIARVEAHRLRKKLKLYYETEGKEHPVQLCLPSGSYIPVFVRTAPVNPQPAAPLDSAAEATAPVLPKNPAVPSLAAERSFLRDLLPRKMDLARIYSLLAASAVVVAVAIVLVVHSAAKIRSVSAETAAAQTVAGQQALAVAGLPIRLIAGYSGQPQRDSNGDLWSADHDFYGGGVWDRSPNTTARTSDPLLFEHWRTGDFFYSIPLPPGVYELHLYFVTGDSSNDAPATFSVSINDKKVLSSFDINADALGENIADERIFRDVSPASDGVLHLGFTSERGSPSLNALEVLPGIPHQQLPIRIVTQSTPITDHSGHLWHPDNYFMNGRSSTERHPLIGTADPDLFATERYGHFTYAIPVDTRGRYTLALHFAEFYFGPQASGQGGKGDRLFRVLCNGETLLDDFDIYKEAGSLHELTKTFHHLKPSPQGKLNLTFEPMYNNATISGIEVLDESR